MHGADELEGEVAGGKRIVTWLSSLREFLGGARQLSTLRREVRSLREEVTTLRTQNDRMRAGMRRCLTCEYRIQAVEAEPV